MAPTSTPLLALTPLLMIEPGKYQTYRNDRFGFSILYPSNYLIPQMPLTSDDDGGRFLSRDGRAEMVVFARDNALDQTLGEIAEGETKPGRTITYRVFKDQWFVLSGYEGSKVFYHKTVLKDGIVKTFHLEADRDLQHEAVHLFVRVELDFGKDQAI